MTATLLPPSATPLMRALAQVDAERIDAIEVRISTLWNPWACPAPFLPYLAWAFSVDVWSPDWSEAKKRAVIAASFVVHRYKGTSKAVYAALDALGFATVAVTEWWQTAPPGERGTFTVDVDQHSSMDGTLQAEALESVRNAKNVRSHFTLRLCKSVAAELGLAAISAPRQVMTADTPAALRDGAGAGLRLAAGSHVAPRFRATTKAA